MRFRVGGLNREPLGSQEVVKFRLRGLGRASLWGEAGSRERGGEDLRGCASRRLSRRGLEPGDEGREDERGRLLGWASCWDPR